MAAIDAEPDSPAICAAKLRVVFDRTHTALEHVDLECTAGEFAAIVGPSGCGKSTLLRVVAGLQSASGGHVECRWPQTRSRSHAGVRVGFVFQEPTLLPWRDVLANVALPLELQHQQRGARIEAARKASALVGLGTADLGKLPRMLSGGMKMRVSLARALVTRPNVMLLDEPFGALDDLLRQQLNGELVRLWQQQRWTTLFVTHNVSEAVFLSQRVLVMSPAPGRITAEIPVPLKYPRQDELRGDSEFAHLVGKVSHALKRSGQ